MRTATMLASAALLIGWGAAGGCVWHKKPVDDKLLGATEAQLEQPFETERTVVADRVKVRMTGNFFTSSTKLDQVLDGQRRVGSAHEFYEGLLALPAVGAQHTLTTERRDDGSTVHRYRVLGGAGSVPSAVSPADLEYLERRQNAQEVPLRMRIGAVRYHATRVIEIEVLGGRHELALEALAEGRVLVQQPDGSRVACQQMRIADGSIEFETGAPAR